METITRGGVRMTRIKGAGVSIEVRAPKLHVAWRTMADVPGMEAMGAGEDGGWRTAISANGLKEVATIEAEPLALEVTAMPSLSMPDSDDDFVELRAMAPADEGILVMVESGGIVQWYLPTNAPRLEMPPAGLAESAPRKPVALDFKIPQSMLARRSANEAVAFGVGGAVVRFFRFKLIRDLLGASTAKVVQWIAKKVEARNKKEGFRFFDRDADYPYAKPGQLAGLSGKRVLLLTHGVFSSLSGAFAGIADPDGAVMRHLRSIYQERIIGWDHWTVAKTPLENATDLLAALPPNIRPDIVCHSRGALITRAMLEHPALEASRASRFAGVGKAVFVAGANQGSPLASLAHINRFLNIYAAIGSIPILGSVGVALKVVVGVLKVLAHGVTRLPSIEALGPDPQKNAFLAALNGELLTPVGEIVVVHANYDPSAGPLAGLLDLNVDAIFGAANDMVVPYTGAEVFDKWHQVGTNFRFGTATQTQSVVMHTNFFKQPSVQDLLLEELA